MVTDPQEVIAARYDAEQFVIGVGRVLRATAITPRMQRVTFTSPALREIDWVLGPAWPLRLYFATPGQEAVAMPSNAEEMHLDYQQRPTRPWTVRRFDRNALEMDVDFPLHDGGGIATNWAAQAQEGQELGFRLPKTDSMATHPGDVDFHVIAGDETGLPAIATTLEQLSAGTRALVFLEVVDEDEEQRLETQAEATITWLHRAGQPAGTSGLLLRALRDLVWPEGRVFVWVVAETKETAEIRRYLRDERHLDGDSYSVGGYWHLGMSLPQYDRYLRTSGAKL